MKIELRLLVLIRVVLVASDRVALVALSLSRHPYYCPHRVASIAAHLTTFLIQSS